jgi:hypothetical protein
MDADASYAVSSITRMPGSSAGHSHLTILLSNRQPFLKGRRQRVMKSATDSEFATPIGIFCRAMAIPLHRAKPIQQLPCVPLHLMLRALESA